MNMYRCKKSTVPSDCDVDDDPIGPVKEKSRDIADFNIFDRDQEYNPFRIWKIQVQKKKLKVTAMKSCGFWSWGIFLSI